MGQTGVFVRIFLHEGIHTIKIFAVDNNNNSIQGSLFFEERICPRVWSTRILYFLFAVYSTNALLPDNHFCVKKIHKKMISKTNFLCKIAQEMIHNEEYANDIRQEGGKEYEKEHLLCVKIALQ